MSGKKKQISWQSTIIISSSTTINIIIYIPVSSGWQHKSQRIVFTHHAPSPPLLNSSRSHQAHHPFIANSSSSHHPWPAWHVIWFNASSRMSQPPFTPFTSHEQLTALSQTLASHGMAHLMQTSFSWDGKARDGRTKPYTFFVAPQDRDRDITVIHTTHNTTINQHNQ